MMMSSCDYTQYLLGMHAALLLLWSEYVFPFTLIQPAFFSATGAYLYYICYAVFLVAMPWWKTQIGDPVRAYALWVAATVLFCVFIQPCYPSSPFLLCHPLFRQMAHHTTLLSTLLLLGQSMLPTWLEKMVYSVLLTLSLYALTLNASTTLLASSYTLACFWCAWVMYDTHYYFYSRDNTHDNSCYAVALCVVADLIVAAFATCLLPYYSDDSRYNKRPPGLVDG